MMIQEVETDLSPREVTERARTFFTTRFSPYAGFESPETEGDTNIRFRFDVGELVIGALPRDGRTLVRGSTSRLHKELSQFLMTLAPPEHVRQSLVGPGTTGAG